MNDEKFAAELSARLGDKFIVSTKINEVNTVPLVTTEPQAWAYLVLASNFYHAMGKDGLDLIERGIAHGKKIGGYE